MISSTLKKQVSKKLKAAYDNAWRKEPVWEQRKVAGAMARKAAQLEINEHIYNYLRNQE